MIFLIGFSKYLDYYQFKVYQFLYVSPGLTFINYARWLHYIYVNFICVWPCIINVGKVIQKNQLDATVTIYWSIRSAQHVSGNILPIIRSVRLKFFTAYGILLLWEAGLRRAATWHYVYCMKEVVWQHHNISCVYVRSVWRGVLDWTSSHRTHAHTPNVMLPYHHIDFFMF